MAVISPEDPSPAPRWDVFNEIEATLKRLSEYSPTRLEPDPFGISYIAGSITNMLVEKGFISSASHETPAVSPTASETGLSAPTVHHERMDDPDASPVATCIAGAGV